MLNQLDQLADYTFTTKYSKYLSNEKRRETYDECITRYFNMLRQKYQDNNIEEYLTEAELAAREKLALGSQRALQFAGPASFKHNARIYNCAGTLIDRPRVFGEAMYLLLAGVGVGFSVQTHHVAWLPDISKPTGESVIYKISDDIEGWGDAVNVLLSSYFVNKQTHPEFFNKRVIFDPSGIRKKDTPFSHGIGKAPGPDGLMKTLENIRKLLNSRIEQGANRLRTIDCYDIMMYSADAVLSGGIRRSATICLFSADDELMMNAKSGNWFYENPQRGRSNNSAVLIKGVTTKEQFVKLANVTKENGEPGFLWVFDRDYVVNPCVEICFFTYDTTQTNWQRTPEYSGWQMCNLSTQNGKKIKSEKDFIRAARAATILGTCQAGFNSFPYLGQTSENIIRRESLLGVSITGMMENPEILFNPILQTRVANICKDLNKELANKIGINIAARITCIKPEGTTSTILSTSSGIHPHHARKYIRRVRANKSETPLHFYKSINPVAIEESYWSNTKSDEIISFACQTSDKAIVKNEISALDLLEKVKSTQIHWVQAGTNKDKCTVPNIYHNVSNTITVENDEWNEVFDFIFENQEYFSGISLLSATGDRDYLQAPFTEVLDEIEISQLYGKASLFASGLIEHGISSFGNLWIACDAALGLGEDLSKENKDDFLEISRKNKLEFISRIKNFSKKYFNDDLKKTTYLLKDVYTWKHYLDLQYQDDRRN